ncbi:MAG: hypothetical protein AB7V42_08575 [Thermoleophilia bacterium]
MSGLDWPVPEVGARIRQTVEHGPFVIQLREDLGMGSCRLTRHRGAHRTVFTVTGFSERSEMGMCCQIVHVRDEADGCDYVVDTGICGPGLPPDAFTIANP